VSLNKLRRNKNWVVPERCFGSFTNIQETYGRSGSDRRNYSPRHNMTNASVLKVEATLYNQAGYSQENKTDNRMGNFRGTE